MLLADLGADVVKVEFPDGGDDTRSWRPPEWSGESGVFLSANRNKRSIAVDLNTGSGQEVVRALAKRADVVVESFRPGSLAVRGLDFEDVKALNDRIIYCSIRAYGPKGPKSHLPGYDPIIQADTGIMDMTGYADGPPTRLGIGAIDLGSALWAAIGIQSALISRAQTGQGARIDVSLFETAVWWLSYYVTGFLGSGTLPTRQGTSTSFLAPYEAFPTATDHLFVAAPNDQLFVRLAGVLGLTELTRDPRFAHNPDRVAHRDALRTLLEEAFSRRPAHEWEEALQAQGVPCSRIRNVGDLVVDPQLSALDLLTRITHPQIDGLQLVDLPISLDGRRATHRHAPPALGEHSDQILGEIDYDESEIARLRSDRVIR
jgi:formyl-CoA transferase/CoA:oxalate CoA-transferase